MYFIYHMIKYILFTIYWESDIINNSQIIYYIYIDVLVLCKSRTSNTLKLIVISFTSQIVLV